MRNSTLSTIARLAGDSRNDPTKGECFCLIKKLSKGYDLTNVEKSRLYKYFKEMDLKQITPGIQWVFTAVDPCNKIESLRYIYSDGLKIYGGDGNRLHFIDRKHQKGYFDNARVNVQLDIIYPLLHIIPHPVLLVNQNTVYDVNFYQNIATMPDGGQILERYFKDAVNNHDVFRWENIDNKYIIRTKTGTAIIGALV